METDRKRIIQAVILVGSCMLLSLGLAIAKMYVGIRSNSLCISLDGLNSFFDVATGVVTLVAFCILFYPRTEKHPYGFGRGEYLAGFVVAAVTVVMGVVFLFRSINRLAMPEPIYYRMSSMIILAVAFAVKIGMTVAYALIERRVRSYALRALLLDSFLDVGMTAVSVLSFTISQSVSYAVDAWLGVVVSVAAMVMGVKMVIDNTKLLLGGGNIAREKDKVQAVLSDTEGIRQVCDVVLSDYGYRCKAGYADVVFEEGMSVERVAEIQERVRAQLVSEGIYLRLAPRALPEIKE